MSSDEKREPHTATDDAAVPAYTEQAAQGERPPGWIYKGFNIFGTEIWYASPKAQLLMVSFVCFLCPGMFNAIGGLGAGGQVDASANDTANTALYAVFAGVAFFAGSIANRLGLKITLAVGGLGYCIYVASFLSYSHNQNDGFVIFAGCFLGFCAGLLWTGQGAIMMSYPAEHEKGRYISWFWVIFNLGAVLGSLIPLGQNINKKAGPVTDGTYIGFIVLMLIGAALSLFMVDADKVIRKDNTKVILMKNPSWKSELIGLFETFVEDPWIFLLFPMFFSSNIFYSYQNNVLNAAFFNTRTRSLNGLLYWLAQIIGALMLGYALDYTKIRRTSRARIAWGFLLVLTFAIWGGGWAWQKDRPTREVAESKEFKANDLIDWTDGGKTYIAPMFLYFFYGMFDAFWQTCVYWFMGALSNNGRKAANLAGFYKGIQSIGNAVYFNVDRVKTPYNVMFGSIWGLLAGSLICAAPLILMRIKDHVELEEDLKFSDETVEDVIAGPTEKRTYV